MLYPQIPLSGYGGTSNVILEEMEKHSEGYIATLTGVKLSNVSKLCVCVHNTGSRAAYVKAVIYTDLQKLELADTTVFSLAPSQFVLKERTKEVCVCCSIFFSSAFSLYFLKN